MTGQEWGLDLQEQGVKGPAAPYRGLGVSPRDFSFPPLGRAGGEVTKWIFDPTCMMTGQGWALTYTKEGRKGRQPHTGVWGRPGCPPEIFPFLLWEGAGEVVVKMDLHL